MSKILVGFAVVMLAGCTSTSNLINTAYIIDQNGGVTETLLSASLSQEEITIVFQAEKDMLSLRESLNVVKSDPSLILSFDSDVQEAVISYLEAKQVYLNHKEEYSESDRKGLESFNNSITTAYDSYKTFKKQGKYLEAARSAIELAKLGAKVAIIVGV